MGYTPFSPAPSPAYTLMGVFECSIHHIDISLCRRVSGFNNVVMVLNRLMVNHVPVSTFLLPSVVNQIFFHLSFIILQSFPHMSLNLLISAVIFMYNIYIRGEREREIEKYIYLYTPFSARVLTTIPQPFTP